MLINSCTSELLINSLLLLRGLLEEIFKARCTLFGCVKQKLPDVTST